MPDQNSAANEHAIMQEITQPLAELPHDPVAAVASVDFPLVLRGYDRDAVDEYVRRTTQLVAELYATRSPEGAVRRALERVGEQVSAILSRAHETAEGITSQSRAEAEERLMRARAEAEELERDTRMLAEQLERDTEQKARERERAAELRVQELDAEVDRIWVERDRIVSDVRKLSEELSELSGAAATRFPAATTEDVGVLPPAGTENEPLEPAAAGVVPFESEAPAEPAPDLSFEEESRSGGEEESQFEGEEESQFEGEEESQFEGEPESEYPTEPEAELREIPADMNEDPLVTDEHELAVDQEERHAADAGELAGSPASLDTVPSFDEHAISAEQPTSVFHRPGLRVIDLHHLGRERVIGCWQVEDILIDPGPASCLEALLAALTEPPRALLLTHIHLDHAGAAGSLVSRWPELEVYVHERGAPHLADPTRLLESARRLYGDDMERLWGEVLPVPEANLRVLTGGEQLFDGRFEVAYTPGHASHHVSYLHEQTAFVGDVAGVRIPPESLTIPPTPPPDIDIEAWHGSIDQLLRWKPERLAMTHFGDNDDIGGQLADLAERLDMWAALVRTEDLESFVGIVESEIANGASPTTGGAYKQAAPPEQIYAGLERYWRKRDGALDTEELSDDEDTVEGPQGSAAEASTHAGRSARASRWVPPTG